MPSQPRDLPQLLGEARRWFEEGLSAAMAAAGAAPVSPTQVQLCSVLDEEGTTVSELARRMGVTRQTAHQAVHGLVAAGILEQVPDPASARQRLIRRTAEGERAHRQAKSAIAGLERQLTERIGEELATALRTALETPWGPVPGPGPELAPGSAPR
ncbi:MarR family transcriptional regulator [Streptomyces sp. BG9H]|uniref:MarR family transcriptional regulator n=1 Tax=Streptomyces anatolicus TaxID=2675858 RepID=A0ABS6YT35_9ACTN|nr:MarR family winged helix-turn-helix transcriptional regulator [Streptomyces anatolicus]MBW5424589.1 MarR family transcriptional regulator [Streptomyces anatolicus]